jgi:hypothetical protein
MIVFLAQIRTQIELKADLEIYFWRLISVKAEP